MKSIRSLVFAAVCVILSTGIVAGRTVYVWPYNELIEKSDLVVIAAPISTNDTAEHIDLPGFAGEHVIGIETKFSVAAILKGDPKLAAFVLHHYRAEEGPNIPHIPNGPTFVSFPLPANSPTSIPQSYLLFLIREASGRYAPVVGQSDPAPGLRALVNLLLRF